MTHEFITRRDALTTLSSALWFPVADAAFEATAAVQKKPAKTQASLNRYPRMVYNYFSREIRDAERKSLAVKNGLKTKADAERFVKQVRANIRESFGEFPERTPLKPRITGVLKRDSYNVEKLIFESRPGFLVTANLYVPHRRAGSVSDRSPAVIGACGHSPNGKAAPVYQSFAQGLARQGYVVLAYDPIGQGERLQYVTDKLRPKIGFGTREHLHAGNQQFLVGEFLGLWRGWDGIRALDYLLTRKEVDPKRIGVTGNSGGGTMTAWLCGLDQRFSMAAPSCFVTTFRRKFENGLAADTEQCPPKALALGLDHDDFLAALAPKPVILLAQEKDFGDVRGTEEAYRRLKRLYKLLGAEKNIQLFIGPTYHGYSQHNREAMYGWFNKANGLSKSSKEPKLKIEEIKDLWCTKRGQVAALKSKTVFDFTRAKALHLKKKRKPVDAKSLPALLRKELRLPESLTPLFIGRNKSLSLNGRNIGGLKQLRDVLQIERKRTGEPTGLFVTTHRKAPESFVNEVFDICQRQAIILKVLWTDDDAPKQTAADKPPAYRIIRQNTRGRGYPTKYAIGYAVETEPGIEAIVTRLSDERIHSRPPRGSKRAVLYVAGDSADRELREEDLVRTIRKAEPKTPFFAMDVRGVGDSKPNTPSTDYVYAIHAIMLDRPYIGMRTLDVLRSLDFLAAAGHSQVHLVASARGCLPATFAAVLSDRVKQVTLKNPLQSWHKIATTEYYREALSSFLYNGLARFDLPDCYAALKSKKLKVLT